MFFGRVYASLVGGPGNNNTRMPFYISHDHISILLGLTPKGEDAVFAIGALGVSLVLVYVKGVCKYGIGLGKFTLVSAWF